jgi:N-methylhydantoinase A
LVKDYSRTILWRVTREVPHTKLKQEFSTLERNAAKDFREESWRGTPHYARTVDLRYRGQGYELNLPFTRNLLKDFEQEHCRRYGYSHPGREVELVTLRMRAVLKSTTTHVGADAFVRAGRAKLGRPSTPEVQVLFDGKKLKTKICAREELVPGKVYRGPAVVTEYSATTVIPPTQRFRIDKASNLLIST